MRHILFVLNVETSGVGGVLLHMQVLTHAFVAFYFWWSAGWSGIVQQSCGMGRQPGRPVSALSASPSLPSILPIQTASELVLLPECVCLV